MNWRFAFIVTIFWSSVLYATSSVPFPPPGMTLPEYWGEEHVWWHGRANFKGQVILPACTLAMEDTYQVIDMGETPVRDLQNSSVGAEKKFRLRLRNCELAGTGKRVYTASRVRVTLNWTSIAKSWLATLPAARNYWIPWRTTIASCISTWRKAPAACCRNCLLKQNHTVWSAGCYHGRPR